MSIFIDLKNVQRYEIPKTKSQFHKNEYLETKDFFVGITNPEIRKIAKKYYRDISNRDLETLITNHIHEYRLLGLIILTEKFRKADINEKKKIVEMYLKNIEYVNNWDLVDLSAYKILGQYLYDIDDFTLLYEMSKSENLWIKRISIVSTWLLIKNDNFMVSLDIIDNLMQEKHDLLHKACGWMLREIGKKNIEVLSDYIYVHYLEMPRTMLRYAIEKYPEHIRQAILKGDFSWI